ncbi:hypothetical protein V8F33_008955 [Rhypophila sp. PSN 637]
MQDEEDNKTGGGGGGAASGIGGAWPRIERIRTDTSAIRHFPAQRLANTGHGHIPDDSYEQDHYEFEDDNLLHPKSKAKSQDFANASAASQVFEPKLKPGLIDDILRTRNCVPGSVFLVERIDDLPLWLADQDLSSGSTSEPETEERLQRRMDKAKQKARHRMVRLMLGDGELCIQALLRPGNSGLLDGGLVYEGCYVRLGNFELKRGQNKMFYLVVGEMVTVGWNRAYLGILRDQEVGGKVEQEVVTVRDGKVTSTGPGIVVPAGAEVEVISDEAAATELDMAGAPLDRIVAEQSGHQPKPTTTAAIPSAMMNYDDIENDLDDESFEKLVISMDRVAERRLFDRQQAEPPKPRISNIGQGGALQELQTAVVEQNKVNANTSRTPHHNPNLALAITDPHQPLKITPLRSIPNLPYKQNWMVNVLAVVLSLSSVEPSHLPPYSQRTARLADPSTSKRVLLNVFLDPEEFTPAVGSVVLLVGVKNHRFDGGCLKKYASDRPPGKTTWWLENPGLEWCAGEVGRLRSWWGEQQQLQQQEVHDGELDKMQIGPMD